MNKKLVTILGILVLLLIIFVGIVTYYKEKELQIKEPLDGGESFISDYQSNFPSNFKELSVFIEILKNVIFSDEKELEDNKEIRAIGLYMPDDPFLNNFDIIKNYLNEKHLSFTSLESISVLKANQYFGISINVQDIIQSYIDSLPSEENILHFCTISEPALTDPLFEEIESENDFWFSQGSVSCMKIDPNEDRAIIFVGFIPQAELINFELYLVDDYTIFDIRDKKSFSEMKEVLENYPLLWQMEKIINL